MSVAAHLLDSASTLLVALLAVAWVVRNPEKVEKWLALLFAGVVRLRVLGSWAEKKRVQFDVQARTNAFVKRHGRELTGAETRKLRLEFVDAETSKRAFLENDAVVLRIRRGDARHESFVKAVYLFISTSLLYRAKRYMSPSQGTAVDLFVATRLLQEERPEVFGHFADDYLQGALTEKITAYYSSFEGIDKTGLFFTVFLSEMDFLGRKVFGKQLRSQVVVVEVDQLLAFLRTIAERRVGDTAVPLEFQSADCSLLIVIVGKRPKVADSIEPYIKFIGRCGNAESLYLIGPFDHRSAMDEICARIDARFELIGALRLPRIVLLDSQGRPFPQEQYVCVLRRRRAAVASEAGA